ncbi:hypothetical protein DFJ77DRAFT_450137 [Powellomyces hirtus]|nr:hypothetical protein DFJ77DRAFT_450137 [Powellomyces hirtus]
MQGATATLPPVDPATSNNTPSAPLPATPAPNHHPQQSTPYSTSYPDTTASEGSSVRSSPYPAPPTRSHVLRCPWRLEDETLCSIPYTDPEALYLHLTDAHVGRKTTGNLCLSCRVLNCTQALDDQPFLKRDHITSHLRSHVPLKANPCQTCSKSFKWPHDLKKHYAKTGHGPPLSVNGSDSGSANLSTRSLGRRRSVRSASSSNGLRRHNTVHSTSTSRSLYVTADEQQQQQQQQQKQQQQQQQEQQQPQTARGQEDTILSPAGSGNLEPPYGLFRSTSYESVYSLSSVSDSHSEWSENHFDDIASVLTAESSGLSMSGAGGNPPDSSSLSQQFHQQHHHVADPNPVDVHLLSRFLDEISFPQTDVDTPLTPHSPALVTDEEFADLYFTDQHHALLSNGTGMANMANTFGWTESDIPTISISPVIEGQEEPYFPPMGDNNNTTASSSTSSFTSPLQYTTTPDDTGGGSSGQDNVPQYTHQQQLSMAEDVLNNILDNENTIRNNILDNENTIRPKSRQSSYPPINSPASFGFNVDPDPSLPSFDLDPASQEYLMNNGPQPQQNFSNEYFEFQQQQQMPYSRSVPSTQFAAQHHPQQQTDAAASATSFDWLAHLPGGGGTSCDDNQGTIRGPPSRPASIIPFAYGHPSETDPWIIQQHQQQQQQTQQHLPHQSNHNTYSATDYTPSGSLTDLDSLIPNGTYPFTSESDPYGTAAAAQHNGGNDDYAAFLDSVLTANPP